MLLLCLLCSHHGIDILLIVPDLPPHAGLDLIDHVRKSLFDKGSLIEMCQSRQNPIDLRMDRRLFKRLKDKIDRTAVHTPFSRHRLEAHIGTDLFLDAHQFTELFGTHQRDRLPRFACATGTSDTVDIALRIKGMW